MKNRVSLKFKKDKWELAAPGTRSQLGNYYQALDNARKIAKSIAGELHIYREDGSLKEIVTFKR